MNFGNTNCYRYLTSQILAASRCGNYYGPELFTDKNQPTYNSYQAQQQRLKLKQQQAEQDYLCPSNYGAFINSVTAKSMPDSLNPSIRLNQQMGLHQLGRNNARCRTDCNEITDSLWSAAKKSSIYVPDTATTWYECQREQSSKTMNLTDKCKMFDISPQGPPQPHQFLRLGRPLRESEQRRTMDPKRFKKISPEFLSILEEHENAMLAHNRLYGVDLEDGRPTFYPVTQREREQTLTPTDCDKKEQTKSKRSSRTRAAKKPERRGLIQTLSETCFPKSAGNKSSSGGGGKISYADDDDVYRPAGGQDVCADKKKNSNETSRIKIRCRDMADSEFHSSIFVPKTDYKDAKLAQAIQAASSSQREHASFCERVLNAELLRVKDELAKKARQRESALRRRKEREEKAQAQARGREKAKDKEKEKQKEGGSDNEGRSSKSRKRRHRTILKDMFGGGSPSRNRHTHDSTQLRSLWEKKDKTRMYDSDIIQQMEDMKKWAATEPRVLRHKQAVVDCEEEERLKKIADEKINAQYRDTQPRVRNSKVVEENTAKEKKFENYSFLHVQPEVGALKRRPKDLANIRDEKPSITTIAKRFKNYKELYPRTHSIGHYRDRWESEERITQLYPVLAPRSLAHRTFDYEEALEHRHEQFLRKQKKKEEKRAITEAIREQRALEKLTKEERKQEIKEEKQKQLEEKRKLEEEKQKEKDLEKKRKWEERRKKEEKRQQQRELERREKEIQRQINLERKRQRELEKLLEKRWKAEYEGELKDAQSPGDEAAEKTEKEPEKKKRSMKLLCKSLCCKRKTHGDDDSICSCSCSCSSSEPSAHVLITDKITSKSQIKCKPGQLKGIPKHHKLCYKDSKNWTGVNIFYPKRYKISAKESKKDLQLLRRHKKYNKKLLKKRKPLYPNPYPSEKTKAALAAENATTSKGATSATKRASTSSKTVTRERAAPTSKSTLNSRDPAATTSKGAANTSKSVVQNGERNATTNQPEHHKLDAFMHGIHHEKSKARHEDPHPFVLKLSHLLHKHRRKILKKRSKKNKNLEQPTIQAHHEHYSFDTDSDILTTLTCFRPPPHERIPDIYEEKEIEHLRNLKKKPANKPAENDDIDNGVLSEPSTSSLEDMLERIQMELSKRKSGTHGKVGFEMRDTKELGKVAAKSRARKENDSSTSKAKTRSNENNSSTQKTKRPNPAFFNPSKSKNDSEKPPQPKSKKKLTSKKSITDIPKTQTEDEPKVEQTNNKKKKKHIAVRAATKMHKSHNEGRVPEFPAPKSPELSERCLREKEKAEVQALARPQRATLGTPQFILGTQHATVNMMVNRVPGTPITQLPAYKELCDN